jgi:hypothetical protein
MSTADLDNRIAAKTRDLAPPGPLVVEVWVRWSDPLEYERERAYDLHDAANVLMLQQDLCAYAHAGVAVEIRPGGAREGLRSARGDLIL